MRRVRIDFDTSCGECTRIWRITVYRAIVIIYVLDEIGYDESIELTRRNITAVYLTRSLDRIGPS